MITLQTVSPLPSHHCQGDITYFYPYQEPAINKEEEREQFIFIFIFVFIRNQLSTRKNKEREQSIIIYIYLYLLLSLSLSLSFFIREQLLTRSKKASNLAVFPHGAADTQTHSRKWRRKTHLATLAPFFRLFLHSLFASTVFWGLTKYLQLWMELFFTLLLFSRAPAAGKPENSI